jgi:hypothetical protein
MSAKICFLCNDALSATTPVAKTYAEDGIPPCHDCLAEMVQADEDFEASLDEFEEEIEEPTND